MNLEDPKMQENTPLVEKVKDKKPDDKGNIQIDCHVKIYDPESQQVLLETRA
jgi:hypothetical protein